LKVQAEQIIVGHMPDLTSITAAITGIRHATEIAKLIREAGPTLAEAEHKLKLAEIIDSLADAKMAIAELKDEAEQKDAELKRLRDALSTKAKFKHNGVFYVADGDPAPFCPRCWEVDNRPIHVGPEVWDYKLGYYLRVCPQCKSGYKTRDSSDAQGAYCG
jgi:chaperonin cofactor prefoldin